VLDLFFYKKTGKSGEHWNYLRVLG